MRRLAWWLPIVLAGGLACGDENGANEVDQIGADAQRARALLIVTIDTVAAEHCSVYGYERDTTPFLNELAERAVVFERAYAPSSTTAPSHASLFSGWNPVRHGVRLNGLVLPQALPLLSERLQAEGWQTGGFVSAFPLSRVFGWDRGFDRFDDPDLSLQDGRVESNERRGEDTLAQALRWLDTLDRQRPWFLWLHFFDAHDPYEAIGSAAQAFGRETLSDFEHRKREYDREILYVDQQIRALFEALESARLTSQLDWLVCGDHGEAWMQHGILGHSPHLYEEQIRVPFLYGGPQVVPRRIEEPAISLEDVMPTLSERLGFTCETLEDGGRSLKSLLEDAATSLPARPIFGTRRLYAQDSFGQLLQKGAAQGWNLERSQLEMRGHGPMYSIVQWPWKLIAVRGTTQLPPEVYRLDLDPGEQTNRQQEDGQAQADLRRRLFQWIARTRKQALQAEPAGAEAFERLAELGYAGGGETEDED